MVCECTSGVIVSSVAECEEVMCEWVFVSDLTKYDIRLFVELCESMGYPFASGQT